MYRKEDKDMIVEICNEWSKRTRMKLEFDEYSTVIQKDVNNYIIIDDAGHVKRKGAYVKKLSNLDNDMPIVNKAIVDYFTKNIPVEKTIMESNKLIDFQKITKISSKYDFGFKEDLSGKAFTVTSYKEVDKAYNVKDVKVYHGYITNEKVHRCFASLDPRDGTLYKKHKSKASLDKTGGTPVNCFIDNDNVLDKPVPSKLDRQWYIDIAKQRIKDFVEK
jgi:hypothetical protein